MDKTGNRGMSREMNTQPKIGLKGEMMEKFCLNLLQFPENDERGKPFPKFNDPHRKGWYHVIVAL